MVGHLGVDNLAEDGGLEEADDEVSELRREALLDLRVGVEGSVEVNGADLDTVHLGHDRVVEAQLAGGREGEHGLVAQTVELCLDDARLLGVKSVLPHGLRHLFERPGGGAKVLLHLHYEVALVGEHHIGDADPAEREGGVRHVGRKGRPAHGARLGLAGGGAYGTVTVGQVEAVLAREGGEVGAVHGAAAQLVRQGLVIHNYLAGEDALLGLVAGEVRLIVGLHLFVGHFNAAYQALFELADTELLVQVLPERLVGEARAGDEVLIGAVVTAAGHTALLTEVVDRGPDLTVGDVDA